MFITQCVPQLVYICRIAPFILPPPFFTLEPKDHGTALLLTRIRELHDKSHY